MSLAQIIAENPSWPAIPGKGPWAGLPPELRPIFKQMEDAVWLGSLSWWINLVAIGAIGYNLVSSFPADVRVVWWPEYKRCFLQSASTASAAMDPTSVASATHSAAFRHNGHDCARHSARPVSTWKFPRPIVLSHLFARILVFPYMAAVINYYRLPNSCKGALQSSLLLVGLSSVNGQILLTLRCQAISRHMPYRVFLWLFLWGANAFQLSLFLAFAFTATTAHKSASPLPMGFRVGFHCSEPQTRGWMAVCMYCMAFVQDTIVFLASIFSVSAGIDPCPYSGSRRLKYYITSFGKTLLMGLRSAGQRMIAGPDSAESRATLASVVSRTFVVDSMRAFALSWTMELIGGGLNIAYAARNPDPVRASWSLPLLAITGLIICPSLLNSSRSLAYQLNGPRAGSGAGSAGQPPPRPDAFGSSSGSGGFQPRSRSNAFHGISVLSTVQHHSEMIDEEGLSGLKERRAGAAQQQQQQQQAFDAYHPPVVVMQNMHTIVPVPENATPGSSSKSDLKDSAADPLTISLPAYGNTTAYHSEKMAGSTEDLPYNEP